MVIFYQIKKVQFQKLKELRNYNRKLFLFLPQKSAGIQTTFLTAIFQDKYTL